MILFTNVGSVTSFQFINVKLVVSSILGLSFSPLDFNIEN